MWTKPQKNEGHVDSTLQVMSAECEGSRERGAVALARRDKSQGGRKRVGCVGLTSAESHPFSRCCSLENLMKAVIASLEKSKDAHTHDWFACYFYQLSGLQKSWPRTHLGNNRPGVSEWEREEDHDINLVG